MSDLRTEIAAAVLALQTNGLCELGRVCELCDCFSERDGGKNRDEILLREADAALAVVQKRAEQLAKRWQEDAERFRGCGTKVGYAQSAIHQICASDLCSAFGLATREESNHG